jgi:hypothetical protein
MPGFLQRYLTLCCADDEGAAGRFDNIIGDDRKAVDFEDAFDLHEQAAKKNIRFTFASLLDSVLMLVMWVYLWYSTDT